MFSTLTNTKKQSIQKNAIAALDTFQSAINKLMIVNADAIALVESNETIIESLKTDNKELNEIIVKHTKVCNNIARLIGE